jgi:hypothetical protein
MYDQHLTAGIMSNTALFRALCVKGGTHGTKSIDEYQKELREEERKDRFLKILADIASAISNNPKKTVIVLILVPVAINALTSLINFVGHLIWIVYIIPYFKSLGLAAN